jgi:hypothetical protein
MSSLPKATILSPETVALLPVFRHHLAALHGNHPLAWRMAFSLAEQRWGEGLGLAVAHRSQVFLSALIACRIVPLHCLAPLDIDERQNLTEDEAILRSILSAMRDDDTSQARHLIARVANNRVTAETVRAGLSLAHLLGSPSTSIRRPQAPKLRAVS